MAVHITNPADKKRPKGRLEFYCVSGRYYDPAIGRWINADGFVSTGQGIYGIYQAAQAPAISIPKAEEKSEAIVIPKEPDSPVIFPADPNTFNPVGLVKVPKAGTTNGTFISWMDPLTNTEVFRWDENPNYSNGPHYHIHGTGHYYPGMIVPEPYATIYFTYK